MHVIKTINASELKELPFSDRFDMSLNKDERMGLVKAVLEVVRSKEGGFVIVRGLRLFREGIQEGIKTFNCEVISEVEHDTDAYLERLSLLIPHRRPLHILEQARGIYHLRMQETERHGADGTYRNGGDRRSEQFEKHSMIDLLKERLPELEYRIGALSRFCGYVGLRGIEGLYRLLIARQQKLTISRIHNRNSKLHQAGFPGAIDQMTGEMAASCGEEEINEAIGVKVFDILFPKRPKVEASGTNDDDDEGEGEAPEEPDSDENEKEDEDKQNQTANKPIVGGQDLRNINEKFYTVFDTLTDIMAHLGTREELALADTQKAEDSLLEFGEKVTEMMDSFYSAVDENYPGRGIRCHLCEYLRHSKNCKHFRRRSGE